MNDLLVQIQRALCMVFIGCAVLCGCSSSPASKPNSAAKTCLVQLKPVHHTLYFTGHLQPLHESALISPVDAVIESSAYHYGQIVKKNDTIFVLNSPDLQRQYHDAVTEYLKAKDNYAITAAKFNGTKDLWSAGLVSKNNYLSEQSNLNTTRVALMQSTQKLSELLEKIGDNSKEDWSALSFSAFDHVRQALNRQHRLIALKAPHSGLLLYPPKTAEHQTNEVHVGASIKAGEVLALVGDVSGVKVEIDIPEVDIAHIKLGMPAIIRGIAWGQTTLHGKLVAMNAEASTNNTGGLPSFTALIEVTKLTPAERALLKVGMSASVELHTDHHKKLLIPITAVRQQSRQSVVEVRQSNGRWQSHPVTTGSSVGDDVVIESGLKSGDVILCP